MSVGLNGYDWQNMAQEYVNSKTSSAGYSANNPTFSGAKQTGYVTQAVSAQGNYCTDGIDDGKIGVLSAAGNIVQGAGKAVVNGVKGMFTDKNGKFSILKTLGTVALGAACIAFPAAGLVMCGIGVVSGGTKFVKGVSNALSATTDADAKDAWEAVGDGALTAAVSVAGAKASMGAIKTSAGATSELAKLGENATWLEKAGALGKDMVSSTKNNFAKIKTSLSNVKEAAEIQRLRNSVSKIEGAATDEELSMIKELQIKEGNLANQDALNLANKWQAKADASKAAKTTLENAKTALAEAKKALKEAEKTGDDIVIADKLNDVNKAAEALNNIKNNSGINTAVSNIGNKLGETKTGQYLTNAKNALTKDGIANVVKNIKANKDSFKMSEVMKSLSADAQEVMNFLKSESGTYYEAVNKYGYKNVLEALEVFASYRLIDETV